jgi:hypothetical protein
MTDTPTDEQHLTILVGSATGIREAGSGGPLNESEIYYQRTRPYNSICKTARNDLVVLATIKFHLQSDMKETRHLKIKPSCLTPQFGHLVYGPYTFKNLVTLAAI